MKYRRQIGGKSEELMRRRSRVVITEIPQTVTFILFPVGDDPLHSGVVKSVMLTWLMLGHESSKNDFSNATIRDHWNITHTEKTMFD